MYGGSCDPNVKFEPGSEPESGPGTTLPNNVLSIAPMKYGGSLSEGSQTLSIAAKQVPSNFWYWIVRHAERMMNAIPGKYKGTLVSTFDRSSLLSLLALTADVVNRANMSHLTSGGTQFLWCRILRNG